VPDASWGAFIDRLAELVERIDPPLTMLSLKGFRGTGKALGLSGQGTLVALDLVRGPATRHFLEALDGLVIDLGAQPNVVKDSRLPLAAAAASLPHYASFRRELHAWDPERLYESELSRRLDL
jgi:decaprenylphospho-beta-D-ribofuranose 2-oxidase